MTTLTALRGRQSHRFAQEGKTWGWVIYRTVYTPESSAVWPSVAKLIAYMRREVFWEVTNHQEIDV